MSPALATQLKPGGDKPKLKVVQPPTRTLESVLKEGRGKPCAFKQWSTLVDRQVDQAMGKPGVPKDKKKAREHVLANDRSYWM
jgi:hypothetical protein